MQDQVKVISMIPKFLQFFELAKDVDDKKEIWKLWQEHYGFAAVPPGEAGLERARQLLEDAWEKYPLLVQKLKDWSPTDEAIREKMTAVKKLFNYEEALDVYVIFYIGGFEGNAFVGPAPDGKLSLCFPVETEVSDIFIAHEITHVVHANKAGLSGEAERSIATIIMQEGLATRASQMLVPGLDEKAYIEYEHAPGWLEKCKELEDVILDGVIPYLGKKDMNTVNQFTFGTGSSGVVDREAYYIGWVLVDYLIQNGETMESLASIPERQLDEFIRKAIENYRLVKH